MSPPAESSRWQLLRLVMPYWNSDAKWKARGYTVALLLLTLAQVALVIWTNYWNRALFDALEARSLNRLMMQIGTFVVILLLTVGVTAMHMRVKRWLQLDWRRWLTARLVDKWMTRGHHYQLQQTRGEHDNPDGRIAEDIHVVTESAISLTHSLVYSLLIFSTFANILLTVTGSVQFPGTGLMVPGYMLILAVAYAGAGTVFGMLLGRPLIRATNKLQSAEADFRFGLAHARESSESIALMQGEEAERRSSTSHFAELGHRWYRQTMAYLGIVSFSSGYGVLLPVFPILVMAPQYISGAMTLGVLMQAAQAFHQLTSALSWPIDNLAELARWRASADRVMSLYNDLQDLEDQAAQPQDRICVAQSQQAEIVLRDLCIATPDGQVLIDGLNVMIQRGERVLISGDPAVTIGLFKVLAGLWPWGHGEVWLPAGAAICFLPQRPFLPVGSLCAALSYPQPAGTFAAGAMQHALESAGIAWLAKRMEEVDNWQSVLPLRTQQRLAIARLFLQQPAWVFIEEASSAFEARDEEDFMDMLHRELPDSTLLAISFQSGLERHYQRRLLLNHLPQEPLVGYGTPLRALRKS
ncbi:ABC transporter ATP-binding protein/permease [Metapseudomonas lalkuanensis]|uniref:ABC transporter ATP-binding protein/permease n=1 Tax=Metapseudomonas lalkuanensis TaxID=2604832 RepID=A0A5J6QQ42_9GAMM|nr:SbmA/BacA-like family transporter [Pseudomonas lalkuanensis]QEY62846.1 ABC transporter ATP-binding protein/permease [Pseudomonas lalkuanensis]UCO95927.1 ABC transporter ATP-binding protein/permease [Pseudomonas lalkuanensis]